MGRQHKYLWLSVFSDSRNVDKFAPSVERQKARRVSASGELLPFTPWPGASSLDPAGAPPQALIIGSRSARSPSPPPFFAKFWNTSHWYCWWGVCVRVSQIYSIKHAFNERLLALRDKKLQIIDDVSDLVKQLKQVQSVLGPQLSKPMPSVPTIDPCETPEK